MVTSVRKQAAKIADKAIKQADQQAKAMVQEKQELRKRLEESNLARETEGKDALSALRRLGGKKLPAGEEIILARRLHAEVHVLKRHLKAKGIGIGRFCIDARISDASESSKELQRLTLPPDKDPHKVRLRRGAGKYRLLIEAISKVTKESASTLADRVLRGTSLHPAKNVENLSETEMVQTALQNIVDKIDSEFGIFAKYMEVAELKARHIASGGKENWPKWECFLEQDWCNYEQELADAMNPDFAFWQKKRDWSSTTITWDEGDNAHSIRSAIKQEELNKVIEEHPLMYMNLRYGESGALQDDNFFYVPHAPLGVTDCFNLSSKRKEDPIGHEKSVQKSIQNWRKVDDATGLSWLDRIRAISDQWDAESNTPFGQTLQGNDSSFSAEYAWIVIYPMADNSRLMPMLYMHQEEGGAYLAPLDARNLDIFRDAIWFDETRHMSVFDRIKELLGYRPGTPRVIEDGFRRTAPWFDYNPFFKLKQQRTDDLQMLAAFNQQQWEEK